MNGLKPCPFCGCELIELVQRPRYHMNVQNGTEWYAICKCCCATSACFISDHDAEEAWNSRAKDGEQE